MGSDERSHGEECWPVLSAFRCAVWKKVGILEEGGKATVVLRFVPVDSDNFIVRHGDEWCDSQFFIENLYMAEINKESPFWKPYFHRILRSDRSHFEIFPLYGVNVSYALYCLKICDEIYSV